MIKPPMDLEPENETEEVLLEIYRLTKENNLFLRKIRRDARWAFWFKLLYILLLLGIPILLYTYYIKPQVQTLSNFQTTVTGGADSREAMENFRENFNDIRQLIGQ